jgi:peroxiredoxin
MVIILFRVLGLAALVVSLVNSTTHPICLASDVTKIESFRATAVDGRKVEWDKSASIHIYFFLGTECPVARLYANRIQSLAEKLEPRGVRLVGLSSNSQDSESDLLKFAKELEIQFPLIQDRGQSLARFFHASRTAEVIVVDRSGTIQYRGRVDDQFAPGVKRSAPSSSELTRAIDEILDGKTVTIPSTSPVGCLISFERSEQKDAPVTFTKTIAPILYRHCLECHRTGEIGPFDISEYSELRGWADMIVEVIDQKRMPPWHASPEHGAFKNARQMTTLEIDAIKQWVAAGTPYGNADELPEMPHKVEGWRLAKAPDKIVAMREQPYIVPANGAVDYQYFVVDPKLTDDCWVSAAQVIPGNAACVHHAIVFIRPPDDRDFNGIGWLTAYVPGQRATQFPPGYARRVPAGSKFVFQMHYTPNGREQSDLTQIGINFIDAAAVTNEVFTLVGIDQEFEIPPRLANHPVHASVPWFPKDGELIAIMPHMHLRGKAFQLRSKAGNNESILLDVPHYDFNWQHTYEFTQPLPFQDVTALDFTATFDNSTANPFNPNPDEYVMWGDQTWEEMAVAFFEVARPRKQSSIDEVPKDAAGKSIAKTNDDAPSPAQIAFADAYLKRFDANQDSMVSFLEVPRIVQDYSFYRMDQDGDRLITRDELIAAAKGRRAR